MTSFQSWWTRVLSLIFQNAQAHSSLKSPKQHSIGSGKSSFSRPNQGFTFSKKRILLQHYVSLLHFLLQQPSQKHLQQFYSSCSISSCHNSRNTYKSKPHEMGFATKIFFLSSWRPQVTSSQNSPSAWMIFTSKATRFPFITVFSFSLIT